jgi:predicted 2-oxoglutarate/Fe(II)-dependent dioxygenase YbiX
VIKRLCDFFESQIGLNIFVRPNKLNLHHYTEGDEFAKHIDTGTPIKEWNVGIVLNEDFDGGDYLVFDENDEPIVIDKRIGNVCIYQSQTPHQVTPITRGERWAIAMFIHKFRMNPATLL